MRFTLPRQRRIGRFRPNVFFLGDSVMLGAQAAIQQAMAPWDITFDAMVVAFAFSAGVGVLAGLFPAIKAAKLDPIQALRYE